MLALLDNLAKIRYRLDAAAERVGRNSGEVTLVAVTKYAPLEAIRRLLESGLVSEVRESRIQDVQAKKSALGALAGKVRWRLIGHLQRNKARKALELFDSVDSLDGLELAEALDRGLRETGKILPVLVQVKLSGKETQSGIDPSGVGEFLQQLKGFDRLRPVGLMSIAPMLEPVEAVRPCFKRMKQLFDRHFAGIPRAQLSMGMSRDFELAVEEGATHVRVGSQIFSGVESEQDEQQQQV